MTDSSLEARVPLLEREQVSPEVAALYDNLYSERGVVPNMYKALSNAPGLTLGVIALLKPLMAEGSLPGWYKELIATRAATLNQCEYCECAHRYLAARRGATPEQVANYVYFETGPFTEKEKAGFRYAELLHVSGNAIDEVAYAAVSRHFEMGRSLNSPPWPRPSSSSPASTPPSKSPSPRCRMRAESCSGFPNLGGGGSGSGDFSRSPCG